MGPKVYACLFTAIGLSSLLTAFGNQYLRKEVGYLAFFIVACVLTVVCLIALRFFNEDKPIIWD